MGFSAIGVIQAVMNKRKIRCACLGAVFQLPMSTVTIVEDVGMVLMAGGLLWTL
jgi:diacylglycerol kinase